MKTPLADRIRPKTLDEVVGQKHLIGEGKILRNIIENDEVPNMICLLYTSDAADD